ncbi:MAG: HEAT repeat domain-containing protein [Deltaproteobacteria bacterium]|nr:HEAT repeat domain-containing protein [Deltaproteobacteria bacterium]
MSNATVRASSPSSPHVPAVAPAASIADTLRTFRGGKAPEAWRKAACALLRLSAGECRAIGVVFEDESSSDELRMLVLDLLASAGSFDAQVVMRRLLSLAIARRKSRVFAKYVQRLGSVACPDGQTLRFLMSTYAEARRESPDVRAACAYALGNAAGHSYTSGESEAAVRATDVLRRDLVSASELPEKCAILTALGNAGVSTDVMLLTRFTHDASTAVRAAAALALRKMDVPEARAHLVGMLSDPERDVAERALLAIGEQKLDLDDLERLAELVNGGRTSVALDARLLALFVEWCAKLTPPPERAEAIEGALRLLLGRVDTTNDERTGQWMRPSSPASDSVPPRTSGSRVAVAAPVAAPEPPPRTASSEMPVPSSLPTMPPPPGRAMQQGPLPCSGSYRMVSAPRAAGSAREQMIALGLDPDAHSGAAIPPPPRPDRR